MKYSDIIYGRNEVTLTVFVPWDCCNNCKFCTTKNEYKNLHNEIEIEKYTQIICKQLEKYTSNDFFTHVVFTGGEPFRDLNRLNRFVTSIQGNKKIYINTSFSFAKNEDTMFENSIEWISINRNKISGVSISRPLQNTFYFNEEKIKQTIELGNLLKLDAITSFQNNKEPMFRLNSFVEGNESSNTILKFIDKWGSSNFFKHISFRSDYTVITPETLHSFNEKFFRKLMSMQRLEFFGSTQCLVCHTDFFKDNNTNSNIIYHRGIKTTSLIFNKKLIINDVVMKQNGSVYYDWEGKNISIDNNKQILNEIFN